MGNIQNREIHLKNYPEGTPQESDFAIVDAPLSEPQAGELLVRNQYFSLDPYMRARMSGQETYVPPYELDAPLDGHCVGYVEMSRSEHIKEGECVAGGKGWREAFVTSPEQVERIQPAEGVPLQAYLGVLGMTGFTAYTGLFHIGQLTGKETVFVSAVQGALALQRARSPASKAVVLRQAPAATKKPAGSERKQASTPLSITITSNVLWTL